MNENITANKCAVVSQKMRLQRRIFDSFANPYGTIKHSLPCQFAEKNLIEYEEEWFCLAHLPRAHPDKRKKKL
jgi:hypothetical protein